MAWHCMFRLGITLLLYRTQLGYQSLVSAAAATGDNRLPDTGTKSKSDVSATTTPGGKLSNYVYYQGVQGRPGIDFPIFTRIPRTSFNCRDVDSGYYADLETDCQVFHICNDGLKVSFLCPNGTIFRQSDLICDWWFKVNCPKSPDFYQESAEQLRVNNARKKASRRVLNRGDITFTSKEVADRENAKQYASRKLDTGRTQFIYRDRNHGGDDESQLTQESSYYNSARQTLASRYPNHKNTYTEIQNPRNYYTNLPSRNQTSTSYTPQTFASTNQLAINNGQPFIGTTQKYSPELITTTRSYVRNSKPTEFATLANDIKSTSRVLKVTTDHYDQPFTSTAARPPAKTTKTRDYVTPKPVTKVTATNRGGKYSTSLSTNQRQVPVKVVTPKTTTSTTTNSNQASYSDRKIIRKGYSVDVSDYYKQQTVSTTSQPSTTVATSRRGAKAIKITGGNYLEQFYKNAAVIDDNARVKPNYYTTTTSDPFTTAFPQYVYSTSKPKSVTRPKPFTASTTEIPFTTTFLPRSETTYASIHDVPSYSISSASPFAAFVTTTSAPQTNYYIPTVPTIKDNTLQDMINTLRQLITNRTVQDSLANEDIPPSVGPQTLHSLAVYFANALDSNRETLTTPLEDLTTTLAPASFDAASHDNITSLLTHKTLQNYRELFKENTDEIITTMKAITTKIMETYQDDQDNDLDVQHSNNLVQNPRVRELAKVFSQALSSYLDNPDMFRRVLQEIRPTEPPIKSHTTTKEPSVEDDELLNFSDADITLENSRYPIPTTTTPSASFAPTWGYIIAGEPQFDDNSNRIGAEQENLQGADSLSLVSQLNSLSRKEKVNIGSSEELLPNHWTSSPDATKLWQSTLYVNALAVNDRLQAEDSTESSVEETQVNDNEEEYVGGNDSTYDESTNEDSPITQESIELKYELRALPEITLNASQVHGILIDFMNSTEMKQSNKLENILKKFNTTEHDFLDKMKEIEKNPLTRRLILLLINECSGNSKEREVKTEAVENIIKLAQNDEMREEFLREKKENNFEQVREELKQEDQDSRALQLLNSLYTIAAKYGK